MRVLVCLDAEPAQDAATCTQTAFVEYTPFPRLSVDQVQEMAPHIFLFLAVCWCWKKIGQQARA